MIQILQ